MAAGPAGLRSPCVSTPAPTGSVAGSPPTAAAVSPSNTLGLDYRAEAARLGPPITPIIDVHSHINGRHASAIYREARGMFGVVRTYSMSQYAEAASVREVLGDSIRFIAVPDFTEPDRTVSHGEGFLHAMDRWHALGARMVKFWCAPRGRDLGRESGDWRLLTLHNPMRRRHMAHARSLGMMFMFHIADPDTWFATKYADPALYGTKRSHYEPLEELAAEFGDVPWLLAHMGGWPEDLDFLDSLLERHPNFHLDTSAMKWMIRELSKHPRERYVAFLQRWRGRVLFGSDIVTNEGHIGGTPTPGPPTDAAGTPEKAFELYASRYWALRIQYETSYEGLSPIADPDLALVAPDKHGPMDSPPLRGHDLPSDLRRVVYHDAAANLVERWYDTH